MLLPTDDGDEGFDSDNSSVVSAHAEAEIASTRAHVEALRAAHQGDRAAAAATAEVARLPVPAEVAHFQAVQNRMIQAARDNAAAAAASGTADRPYSFNNDAQVQRNAEIAAAGPRSDYDDFGVGFVPAHEAGAGDDDDFNLAAATAADAFSATSIFAEQNSRRARRLMVAPRAAAEANKQTRGRGGFAGVAQGAAGNGRSRGGYGGRGGSGTARAPAVPDDSSEEEVGRSGLGRRKRLRE